DLLGLRTRNRALDRKVQLLGFRKELRILHRSVEGRTQDREAIGGHLLRHHERATERIGGHQDVEDLPGFLGRRQIAGKRHARLELWYRQGREGDQRVDLVV